MAKVLSLAVQQPIYGESVLLRTIERTITGFDMRRVTDPGILEFVDELAQAGAKPKLILQYLQDTSGKLVELRGLHNLVQRMKAKRRSQCTVEDRLEAVLRTFCSYRGNQTSIFVDDTKTTQIITLQTRQMKRFFVAFP
ncbi:hypothetical protein PHMEG_0008588 [Phytophthora megakarya]|uniref:ZSWIM1/3 RNaseH-like domain-containing protein n=1 Tax=Phytophthora megakarya TaxID=4795 RepID=A0A225WKE4_9STRA|nr:hypothetical protein PHMEG_0008588 [Phytophthora megakarya]